MSKITLDGFLHYKPAQYEHETPSFTWYVWSTPVGGSIVVGPHQITLDVPDDFNPIAAAIVSLEAKLEEAGRAFLATKTQILAQISKLQAIGSAVEVAG